MGRRRYNAQEKTLYLINLIDQGEDVDQSSGNVGNRHSDVLEVLLAPQVFLVAHHVERAAYQSPSQ